LAIVDPGVGSGRFPVAVQAADGSWLVGPDNGLLVPAAARLGGATSARKLENPELRAPNPSRTFHGRDVFAPAAAHLARGVALEELGPQLDPSSLVRLVVPEPSVEPGRIRATVLTVDGYGSAGLNLQRDDLARADLPGRVRIA